MIKVHKYIISKSVKTLSACTKAIFGNFVNLKYGIEHGSSILRRHLLALFFYTDFTDLCTDFSATFRQIKQFEPLSSIKRRNAVYWWMSKNLRECVELYGQRKTCVDW
eukprot:901074_1